MLEELTQAIEFVNKYNNFEDRELIELRNYANEHSVPIITKDVAAFLDFTIKLHNPNKILEIGTAIGYSGSLMLKAAKNSKLTTIEKNQKMYELANKNFKATFGSEFENRINLIFGDATEEIDNLDSKYDLIFLDANKSKYLDIFYKLYKLLSEKGIIVIDNVLFRGYVYKDEYPKRYKTIVRKLKELINYLSENYNCKILPFGDGICLVDKR